jgi:hypothetical protein
MGSVDHFTSDRQHAGVGSASNAATIASAWAISSAEGVKAALIGPI